MTVLQEILQWSRGLPSWQSDAIRRIVENGEISEADIDDLAALAKAHSGVPDPQGRVPVPLNEAHVPETTEAATSVRLCALRNLENVNAIAPVQELAFAETGLTVIYGDNGAGKSGYSRVLKRACRARDEKEAVLPNAKLPPASQGTPSATIGIKVGNEQREETWHEGKTPPAILGSVAVFDSHCARVYIDNETDVVFVPYGLDIPEHLVKACIEVKNRIQEEANGLVYNSNDFADLAGDTWVGAAIALLPDRLDPDAVKQLATLGEREIQQRALLENALRQPDPAERIRQLGRLKQRVMAAKVRAHLNSSALSDEALGKAQMLDREWREAKAAADLAARALTDDPRLLPGTGGETWKKLFDAARCFSETCAYPGHTFPCLEEGARCPLCQQELKEGADNLSRFDAFVKGKTEKDAEDKRKLRDAVISTLKMLDTSALLDTATLAEVAEVDSAAAEEIRILSERCATRRQETLDAFQSGDWKEIGPALPSFDGILAIFEAAVNVLIAALQQAVTGNREELQRELWELDARQRLAKRLAAVLAAIEREKMRQKLVQCARAITTTGISRKATELTNAAVTEQLAAALNTELQSLRFEYVLEVKLDPRTVQGVTRHKLILNAPPGFDVSKVLSEGEQRAIAIAAFLAEACGDLGVGTLVFDDPVSSLDHERREAIAQRLVQAATTRQVVLFTHDLYFLSLTLHEAETVDPPVSVLTQMVVRGGAGPGMVIADLPFQGKNTSARVGEMKQLHQQAAACWRGGNRAVYDSLARDIYRKLRDSWERAVEEVLFNRTIERFRKSIETNRLRLVTIEAQDQQEVEAGMTKSSNYAHDTPLMAGANIPAPDEISADIEALETFRRRIIERQRTR